MALRGAGERRALICGARRLHRAATPRRSKATRARRANCHGAVLRARLACRSARAGRSIRRLQHWPTAKVLGRRNYAVRWRSTQWSPPSSAMRLRGARRGDRHIGLDSSTRRASRRFSTCSRRGASSAISWSSAIQRTKARAAGARARRMGRSAACWTTLFRGGDPRLARRRRAASRSPGRRGLAPAQLHQPGVRARARRAAGRRYAGERRQEILVDRIALAAKAPFLGHLCSKLPRLLGRKTGSSPNAMAKLDAARIELEALGDARIGGLAARQRGFDGGIFIEDSDPGRPSRLGLDAFDQNATEHVAPIVVRRTLHAGSRGLPDERVAITAVLAERRQEINRRRKARRRTRRSAARAARTDLRVRPVNVSSPAPAARAATPSISGAPGHQCFGKVYWRGYHYRQGVIPGRAARRARYRGTRGRTLTCVARQGPAAFGQANPRAKVRGDRGDVIARVAVGRHFSSVVVGMRDGFCRQRYPQGYTASISIQSRVAK